MRRAALSTIAALALVALGPARAQQPRNVIIPGAAAPDEDPVEQERQAKLRAEIESRVRAQVEKELRALAEKEARAKARADAKARKKGRKDQKPVEAKPLEAKPLEAPPLPELPAAPVAFSEPAPPVPPAAAELRESDPSLAEIRLLDEPLPAAPAETPPMALVNAAAVAPAPVEPPRTIPVPRDEQPAARRRANVRDEFQLGPQSLVLNRLSAGVDAVPGALAATFAYRLINDDAGALHHHFALGAQSAADADVHWFANAGFGPDADNAYRIPRSSTSNRLGWSAYTLAAGASKPFPRGATVFDLSADAQVQALSVGAAAIIGGAQRTVDVSLKQVRLRGGAALQSGPFSASAQAGAFVYLGDAPATLRGLPLRGVFIDDDLGGLASAPQSFQARAAGAVDLGRHLTADLSYSYLGYTDADWAGAHLVHAALAVRFGSLRGSLGLTWQYDVPQSAAPNSSVSDYTSIYLTGSIGYAF